MDYEYVGSKELSKKMDVYKRLGYKILWYDPKLEWTIYYESIEVYSWKGDHDRDLSPVYIIETIERFVSICESLERDRKLKDLLK